MAKFIFKLQPVLGQREQIEREKQVVVGAINRERIALEPELRKFQSSIENERDDLRERLGSKQGRFAGVREQALAIRAIDRRAAEVAARLADTFERLGQARGELARASADRRAIELLRERRYAQWQRELLRTEQRELDDVVNGASARRAQEAA